MKPSAEVSATRHTPGPWRANMESDFVESGAQIICQMWDKTEEDFPNKEANARLIASAPELLDALKAIYAGIPDDNRKKIAESDEEGIVTFAVLCSAIRQMQKAIEKAEGRSQ